MKILLSIVSLLLLICVASIFCLSSELDSLKNTVSALTHTESIKEPEPKEAELAPFMTELATFIHKLQLSIDNQNSDLALFYTYEAEEILNEIKEEAPNYGGHDIDGLIESMLEPHLNKLKTPLGEANSWLIDKKTVQKNWAAISKNFDNLITSCNSCHTNTKHGYIQVTRNKTNPFINKFK